jgi:hypothetical protein
LCDAYNSHSFAVNSQVDAHNHATLKGLEGSLHTYEAQDTGTESLINNYCRYEKNVHLKIGAQVMLLKNMSGSLVNGSMGKIIGFRSFGDGRMLPMVHFDNGETQTIGQELWEHKVGGM